MFLFLLTLLHHHLDLCCMICWNHCYIFLLTPSHDSNWSTVLHCCLPFLQLASCSFFDTVFVFTVTFPSQSELHNFRNLARRIIIIIHPQGVASVEQAFRKLSTIAVTFWRVFGNKGWVQNGFLTNINYEGPQITGMWFCTVWMSLLWPVMISMGEIVLMIGGPSATYATHQLTCLVGVGTKPGILNWDV
jgi:hypothetical protein